MKWMLLFVLHVERDRAVFETDPKISINKWFSASRSKYTSVAPPQPIVTGVVSKCKRVQLPKNIINQQMFNFLLARNSGRTVYKPMFSMEVSPNGI